MNQMRVITAIIWVVSVSVLCFEIIATRISSVIFVNDFAFLILSMAILGLACGGIFAFYKYPAKNEDIRSATIYSKPLLLLGVSLFVFSISVTVLPFISNPFVYFFLLFLPFFFAGIFYAKIFEVYAEKSFQVYAADLTGAAFGSIASIWVITSLGPINGILLLSVLIFSSVLLLQFKVYSRYIFIGSYSVLILFGFFLIGKGNADLLNKIPIGDFPEKDFHHSYPNLDVESTIVDSRWSVYGRSDLVEYTHQDRVKHLFIDGAAGSQMFRFDGNLNRQDPVLTNLLLSSPGFIPFLFLSPDEKKNMLIIGPGGGKEVLAGLVTGVGEITGVEINPDFVKIVKDQSEFNGGIYTNFPNVEIVVQEGRQYVKKQNRTYDILVMALPSTQQLQSIDNFALSENYLLTTEAIQDYLNILSPEGQLIFTVHNQWELKKLIISTIHAFGNLGVNAEQVLNHFMIIERGYAPTIVVKKNAFTQNEVSNRLDLIPRIPDTGSEITYLPYQWDNLRNSSVNLFLSEIKAGQKSLQQIVEDQIYDVSATYDDSPYFYKIEPGIPAMFKWLLSGVILANLLVIGLPLTRLRKKTNAHKKLVITPLIFFICIGIGFMIIEISLFQKLILYLGSPTVSLSILLSSLLIGMGIGSFTGKKIFAKSPEKRLIVICTLISILGLTLILLLPVLLNQMLIFDLIYRAATSFILLLPLGFLLGIPFPTCIQLLEEAELSSYIPWMYGVNGSMSLLGSVLAVILSMMLGFSQTFIIGLLFYVFIISFLLIGYGKLQHSTVL